MPGDATLNSAACPCCSNFGRTFFNRRRFLHLAAGSGLALALPSIAGAASGNYEAMLLCCIDPRFPERTLEYMKSRDLLGKYSQFSIAGAAIGVVAPAFKAWHKAFWDNLSASIELHRISRVIALDHRDCAAAKIAYGAAKVANPDIEARTHKMALLQLHKELARRHPRLTAELGLMDLSGKVEMFS